MKDLLTAFVISHEARSAKKTQPSSFGLCMNEAQKGICRMDIRIGNLETSARSCRNVIGLFPAPKYKSCLLTSLRVPVNLSCHLELAKFQHLNVS